MLILGVTKIYSNKLCYHEVTGFEMSQEIIITETKLMSIRISTLKDDEFYYTKNNNYFFLY